MSLFGFGRKNEARVKILGGGCAKCNQLEAATVEALTELGMDTTIDHVKDYEKIANKTKESTDNGKTKGSIYMCS